ncbi:endo-1,4-beta-xylanase [Tautonia plasticadhaerens]|uniref:Beta-xylanase n=1 Tax=Tautonia plasticadhaerens TaxID=2527974 RepID=A0A518H5V2_9BACT|nr:endo-1,4-beta-xylanase [Tautonia plasticadhaerens]QDV36215.1 Endo-1,4-beta-xylanase A precursor [Tautonia plasticadhaerens]
MTHARTIVLAILGGLGAPAAAAPADGPVIITFDEAETGRPMPSYEAQGVVFAPAHPPAKSRAAGRVMFFPHLKTPRKGILNAMADESIPVEARFPEPATGVTLVLWGSIGSAAVVEAYDADGNVVDRAARDAVPTRAGPEQPIPSFELTVEAPAIASVRFSGAPPGGYLVCDEVRVTPSADAETTIDGEPTEVEAAAGTLREAAEGRLLVGAAVMSRRLDDRGLATLVAEQFNCLTGENEFKPAPIHPQPDRFNFEGADRIVAFAQAHDMEVIGHTLCWHSQSPRWMYQGPDGEPLSRDEALRNLEGHIDAVMGHFKGKVVGWDVVNEAISDAGDDHLRNTLARRAIGHDYIVKAFELAHEADPDAELYYNDYDNEQPEKREKTLRLIRELKAAGVRLDAVGMQCHFRLDEPDAPDLLDRAIAAYAAEGVKVMLTELDVDVLPRRTRGADVVTRERGGADPYRDGLPPEVAEAQARYYARIFEVVRKHPGVVTRVTFWGTHDGASWLNSFPVRGRTNHPLLWDRDLEPKPAFEAVLETLATPGPGPSDPAVPGSHSEAGLPPQP